MSIWWQAYLTPSSSAVQFAIKASLAMLLALFIALACDLERPYWALISAAFLQTRPMTGMVFEKGLSQLVGTAVGCLAGIVIMAFFVQAPFPALASLTLWIMLCTYAASLTRNNASYGCIIAAVTAMLIVIITAGAPGQLFDVAVARLTELSLGALCATLVSSLLWPIQVRDHLTGLANEVVNNAFLHGSLRLENSDDIAEIVRTLNASLTPLNQLESDSQSARYEGPEGSGRIRASHVLTQRTVRLLAILRVLQQLLRAYGQHLSAPTRALVDDIADGLRQSAEHKGTEQARERLQDLRHRALRCIEWEAEAAGDSPQNDIPRRMTLGLREALGHALVILDAREAIHTPRDRKLRAPALAWHRDHLEALLNACRSGLIFALIATFWVQTNWDNGQTAMMLGTLFSAMFATRDNSVVVASMFLKGILAAIPSAFVFGHVLLSSAHGFPMLALALMPPLFLGLLGSGTPQLAGYCLAFTIGNILLTMPGNGMDLAFDTFANRAIAVLIGIGTVVMAFRLLPGFPAGFRKHRLVKATVNDLRALKDLSPHEAESRFGGAMADRMLRLARHDDLMPENRRYLFSLGLTALDLGYAILNLRRRLDSASASTIKEARALIQALADDYQASVRGLPPSASLEQGKQLGSTMEHDPHIAVDQRHLINGLVARLHLSLEWQSERSRNALGLAQASTPEAVTPPSSQESH